MHEAYFTKRLLVRPEEKEGVKGYALLYQDGTYDSWCPAAIYERDYHATEGGEMTFGEAVAALKAGDLVRRLGWNGKGMFLFLVQLDELSKNNVYPAHMIIGFDPLPFIAMKTAQDSVVPWLASQTDMLASDWEIVPA
jgi:hypothetical protein